MCVLRPHVTLNNLVEPRFGVSPSKDEGESLEKTSSNVQKGRWENENYICRLTTSLYLYVKYKNSSLQLLQ